MPGEKKKGRKPKYATLEEKIAARKGYKKYSDAERAMRWEAGTNVAMTTCNKRIARAEEALARAKASKACARAAKAYVARVRKERVLKGPRFKKDGTPYAPRGTRVPKGPRYKKDGTPYAPRKDKGTKRSKNGPIGGKKDRAMAAVGRLMLKHNLRVADPELAYS
jgi:hypothetical protein